MTDEELIKRLGFASSGLMVHGLACDAIDAAAARIEQLAARVENQRDALVVFDADIKALRALVAAKDEALRKLTCAEAYNLGSGMVSDIARAALALTEAPPAASVAVAGLPPEECPEDVEGAV
jgi:hypothetical protein